MESSEPIEPPGWRGARPPRPPGATEQYPYYLKDAVANVLLANCGSCHGPDALPQPAAGLGFIGDIDRLVAAGLLVPLDSASSPVVQVMVEGSMPPAAAGLPPATEADINTITQYLDNPRFWPDWLPAARDAGAPPSAADAGS